MPSAPPTSKAPTSAPAPTTAHFTAKPKRLGSLASELLENDSHNAELCEAIAALITATCVCSCDSGTEWSSGDYEVYWIDIPSDLPLGLRMDGGNAIGRVGPQVFAVGEDSTWIVAARHPTGDPFKREFFYLQKALDSPYKNGDEITIGPLTEAEFDKAKV